MLSWHHDPELRHFGIVQLLQNCLMQLLALSHLLQPPVPSCSQLHSALVTQCHHHLICLLIRLDSPTNLQHDALLRQFPTSCDILQCQHVPSCSSLLICIQDSSCCNRISAHRLSWCTTCSLLGPPMPPPPRPEGLVQVLASGLPFLREVHRLPPLPLPDSVGYSGVSAHSSF